MALKNGNIFMQNSQLCEFGLSHCSIFVQLLSLVCRVWSARVCSKEWSALGDQTFVETGCSVVVVARTGGSV